ncbi:MAG: SMI1/KNR4 family protein [Verrucomicrobiota bacterium]
MKKLTNSEISEIETQTGIVLPGLYRKLLVEVGYGEFGETDNSFNTKKKIYHPEKVRELYEPFFDDPNELFDPYFPFGYNIETLDLWIIEGKKEKSAVISHETVPEDWVNEEWLSYEYWIQTTLDEN